MVAIAMENTSKDPAVSHPTHEATGAHNVVLDVPTLGGRMEPSAQAGVERRSWPCGAQKMSPNLGGIPHCSRVSRHGGGDAGPPR
ncbi:unnamed protein product [Sphagnum balticum]